MKTAVFTPTRHPGLGVSYLSVATQSPTVDYWLVADQLALERESMYRIWRDYTKTKIHTYNAEILPGRNGNLEHVSNWALSKARELEVDLLVFLQDFIWIPSHAVAKFAQAAKNHPFDLLTGNVVSSPGYKLEPGRENDLYSIFESGAILDRPPEPHTPDTRDQMGLGDMFNPSTNVITPNGRYLSQHAWEINWGAMPHAIINAGIDFDEDYDYGTQWGNTDFAHQVQEKFKDPPSVFNVDRPGRVWWDYYNQAIALPHREYFPGAHEGERNLDNGSRFRAKWGNV